MSKDLRTRFENLIETVRAAKEKADAGDLIQLGDFEGQVAALCKDAAKAEGAEAHALKPAIADMIASLDALAASLGAGMRKSLGRR